LFCAGSSPARSDCAYCRVLAGVPRWIIARWIVRRYLKPQVKRSPGRLPDRSAKMLAGRAGSVWP
jgi:hypothetical protein